MASARVVRSTSAPALHDRAIVEYGSEQWSQQKRRRPTEPRARKPRLWHGDSHELRDARRKERYLEAAERNSRALDARLGLDVPTPLKVHVSPGKPQIDPDLARALRARYSALRGDIAAARVSVPTGIDGDDNDDEGGTGAEARRQKDRAWDWSPLADYEERASETMAIAAQLRKTTGSNVATRRAPAFTVGKARRTLQTTEGKPATGPDVGPAKYDVSKLHKATSNSRSAPSFSIGVKLKSDEERAVACGYPLLPAPGQGVPVPSFVRESVVENKGPRLMGKLPTRAEIDVKLGIGNGPGPGGSLEVPSFAAENKRQSRGVKLGVRLKSDAERTLALGYKITPAPGGNLPVPSFARESAYQNRGVVFGQRHKSVEEIAEACGFPRPPGPDVYSRTDGMADRSIREGRGVIMGKRLKTAKEILQAIGHVESPAPGGNTKVPSFTADAMANGAGAVFGSTLPDKVEVSRRMGVPPTPAPGGNCKVPSFARDAAAQQRGATFGASNRPPPGRQAVDTNLPVPSFVEDDKKQNKGVVFGTKLKDRREIDEKLGIFHGPAPGGNVPVPSFTEENLVADKGVVFGSKLKDRREIDEKLGIFHGPAPGGNVPVPSFVEDDKKQNKGVVFGSRPTYGDHIAKPPGPGAYNIATSAIGTGRMTIGTRYRVVAAARDDSPGPMYQTRGDMPVPIVLRQSRRRGAPSGGASVAASETLLQAGGGTARRRGDDAVSTATRASGGGGGGAASGHAMGAATRHGPQKVAAKVIKVDLREIRAGGLFGDLVGDDGPGDDDEGASRRERSDTGVSWADDVSDWSAS